MICKQICIALVFFLKSTDFFFILTAQFYKASKANMMDI